MTISNDQFVVPHIYADQDNGLWSQNSSEYDLLVNSGPEGESGGTLRLNRHASTFIYTMVNLDAGEFTIWAANKESNSENLVAVDTNNVIVDQASLCASSSQTVSSSAGPTTEKSSALSGGAIAGIAVGGVAAVALLGLLGWWILRRKRKQSQSQPQPQPPHSQGLYLPGEDTDKLSVPGGMFSTGRNTPVSEFAASGTTHPVSTAVSELPAAHEHQGSLFELNG